MASSTDLEDLAENFFLCSVCLDQFKEPKLLPCLHRYCSDCLKTVIRASNDGIINCPMCKQDCAIPENGVDDFKTDFHMKSILEFIQLQNSFKTKDLKKCVSCSRNTKDLAYCFKCRDFLCDQCYMVHISNRMFADHQRHTLKLNNTEVRKLTLEKLASVTEDPRCHTHLDKEAHLCCSECRNVPICVACIFTKHKGHDLHDVAELASTEKELLNAKLAELTIHKRKLYSFPEKIKTAILELDVNIRKRKTTLGIQHNHQSNKISYKRTVGKTVRETGLKDIENRRKAEESQTSLMFEEELRQLKLKYGAMSKTATRKYDEETKVFTRKCDTNDNDLVTKTGSLRNHLKSLTRTSELLAKQNKDKLQQISVNFQQMIKRYENLTATTASIFASKSSWTYVQCIPDVTAASEPLLEEMKKKFPDLKSLSDIVISDMKTITADDVTISEGKMSVFNIKVSEEELCWVTGMTSSRNGSNVITGWLPRGQSYIIVVNRSSKFEKTVFKRGRNYSPYSYRYCCFLSEFQVATVCTPDEIGIYDTRNGSYNKKYISDTFSSWQGGRYTWSVATDPVNCHIIVGTGSIFVYVFDNQLNYIHTITLPAVIIATNDITVYTDKLLICDSKGKRAYVVTVEGSESEIIYEFNGPVLHGGDWSPFSVCTDKSGFIYMLWKAEISGMNQCIVVQYSQYGRQLLTTRPVDENARCVTISETDGTETLLIATENTGKLYKIGLVMV